MAFIQRLLLLIFLAGSIQYMPATIPDGYYNAASGKKQAELKTALHKIINPHTAIEYYSSSTHFRSTDWHPGGYFWDMYSDYKRSSWSGGALNREHSMPKSWFGVSSGQENSAPIGTDLHNLFPSDANANSAKSNHPLGEANGSPVLTNTIIKVGPSTFPGYSGTVFEPHDQYKGDFARTYMYMVTCYEDYATVWRSTGTSSMLHNNTYPTFKPYAVNLLLKWHRQDEVSEKEINRNEAVYKIQKNRNPFIDYPELAEFIWGTRMPEGWEPGMGTINKKDFKAWYNADNQTIHIEVSKPAQSAFTIYSINGMVVRKDVFGADGSGAAGELKNGIYLIEVYTGNTRKVAKFVVIQ